MNQPTSKKLRRTMIAGVSGNIMEWYDFAIYGYMAATIGKHFFPSDDPMVSLIASYGAFAAGFLSRPLGGILFGYIGDRLGHKKLLMLSVLLMGIASFLIGVLPTQEQIGIAAPILLIMLRICQGLSVGGEYTGSIAYIADNAPINRRGYLTSWIGSGAILGFVAGAGVAALLTSILSEASMDAWGWRVPFMAGILLTLGSLWFRRDASDQPEIEENSTEQVLPFILAFRDDWRAMLQVMGLALSVNVTFYLMFVYAGTYLNENMHVSTQTTMDISTACLVVMLLVSPLSGWVSDKWGRKPVATLGITSLLLFAYPLFWVLNHSEGSLVFAGTLGFSIILGWIYGVNPAMQIELLSRPARVSAFSISYNITLALFGGTAPLLATYLVARTSDDFVPAYYVMGLSIISLIAIFTMKETRGLPLKN